MVSGSANESSQKEGQAKKDYGLQDSKQTNYLHLHNFPHTVSRDVAQQPSAYQSPTAQKEPDTMLRTHSKPSSPMSAKDALDSFD